MGAKQIRPKASWAKARFSYALVQVAPCSGAATSSLFWNLNACAAYMWRKDGLAV